MRKIAYIIICLFFFVGCSTDKSHKIQVVDESVKDQLKNKQVETVHDDTIITQKTSTEVVKPRQSVKNIFTNNNKQINITYKGKDCNRIVKATDIFKNIHYVALETNDAALLKPEPYCIVCRNNYIYILDNKNWGNDIHLYDSKGRYIRDIGKKGEGPEDYLGGLHIAVNNNGMISFPDRMRSEIINYSKEGEFVSRIKMDTISLYKNTCWRN